MSNSYRLVGCESGGDPGSSPRCSSLSESGPGMSPAGSRPAVEEDGGSNQFLLKSKERIASLPSGSFTNLLWQERTEIEPKAFLQRGGEVLGDECLVALKDLGNCLHRIIVEIILLDFRRVEAGVSLNLDHVSAVAGTSQFLAAEIAREVDHQRYIPQFDEPVNESGRCYKTILTSGLGSVQALSRRYSRNPKQSNSCQHQNHENSRRERRAPGRAEPPRDQISRSGHADLRGYRFSKNA